MGVVEGEQSSCCSTVHVHRCTSGSGRGPRIERCSRLPYSRKSCARYCYPNPGRSDFAAPDFTELMILLFKGRLSALSAGSVNVHCQTGTAVSSNAFDQALPMLGSCFVEAPCSTTAVRLPTWSQSSHLCLVYRPLGPDMAHIFEHQHAGLHFLHVPHDGHLRATCKGCGKAKSSCIGCRPCLSLGPMALVKVGSPRIRKGYRFRMW